MKCPYCHITITHEHDRHADPRVEALAQTLGIKADIPSQIIECKNCGKDFRYIIKKK
jgi:hypothetical protein